jgi:hypothetical protein
LRNLRSLRLSGPTPSSYSGLEYSGLERLTLYVDEGETFLPPVLPCELVQLIVKRSDRPFRKRERPEIDLAGLVKAPKLEKLMIYGLAVRNIEVLVQLPVLRTVCAHFLERETAVKPTLSVLESRGVVVVEIPYGRNDPCPCGSGKKYKNCCGKTTNVISDIFRRFD